MGDMAARQGGLGLAVGASGLSHRALEQVLATVAAAVIVSDEEGKIVYANASAAHLTRFDSPEDMLDMSPGAAAERFVMLDGRGAVVSGHDLATRRVARGDATVAEQALRVVERESGDQRWWLLRSAALQDGSGRRLAVTVVDDVTAAKEAELRQAFLARAGEVLASSLEYSKTLSLIAELAVPELADWCGVDVLDERGVRQRLATYHPDPDKVRLARELAERYPPDPEQDVGVYRVLRTGTPEIYGRISDELVVAVARDAHHLELIRGIGMRSLIFAPMTIRDRTIGVLTLVSAESHRAFEQDDLDFAMELARRAAVAVENSRLYTSRTQASDTLQASLLPERLSTPAGWRAASSYKSGDDVAEVGGDFFDVVGLPDGSALAFVGDVTGKGVRAAALTSLARHTLEVGARFDSSPRALMRLLEDVLAERSDAAPITVACVCVKRTGDQARAVLTCAGHPPPILLREGEPPRMVGEHDVLLGAGLGTDWREIELDLRPGDTLLMYTDGILDTPGAEERFGERRLMEVAGAGARDPDLVIERVDRSVAAWRTGLTVDDRAMLALQLEPAPSPAGAVPGGGS